MDARGTGTSTRANRILKAEIQAVNNKVIALEKLVAKILAETKGSVENEIVKATVASTDTVKKLIDFKLTELKALAAENGVNDEGFTKKAEYVKALKEKDPTLE